MSRWTKIEDDLIVSVHDRVVGAEVAELGERLETLGSPDDRMWLTRLVGPLVLDQGLVPGSKGGHAFGVVPYQVVEHDTGFRVRFSFVGFVLDGWHEFSLSTVDENHTRVTHRLEAKATKAARLAMAVWLGSSHDAVIEDIFDNLQRQYGTQPDYPVKVPMVLRLATKLTDKRQP